MIVLDASAVLAWVQGEPGADEVEAALGDAVIGAANWSEISQKVRSRDADWALVRNLLFSFGARIEPVTVDDAEVAAGLWRRGSGLSLADRLCLALAERLDARVLTADRAWGSSDQIVQLRTTD